MKRVFIVMTAVVVALLALTVVGCKGRGPGYDIEQEAAYLTEAQSILNALNSSVARYYFKNGDKCPTALKDLDLSPPEGFQNPISYTSERFNISLTANNSAGPCKMILIKRLNPKLEYYLWYDFEDMQPIMRCWAKCPHAEAFCKEHKIDIAKNPAF
ncbi:hypothetical protein AAIR98_001133 [Elusimicrobium simillimum]|uniref:hypothetical protein n=1 Tax=Elusimicrobium simillimum TaxID=3143438 RepID=UPI003C6F5BBB